MRFIDFEFIAFQGNYLNDPRGSAHRKQSLESVIS
jgi:hypothetical protein